MKQYMGRGNLCPRSVQIPAQVFQTFDQVVSTFRQDPVLQPVGVAGAIAEHLCVVLLHVGWRFRQYEKLLP